jgi:hypothetical protein
MVADPMLATALSVTCPVRWCGARRGSRCVLNSARWSFHWQRARAGLEKEFPDPDNPQRKEPQHDRD